MPYRKPLLRKSDFRTLDRLLADPAIEILGDPKVLARLRARIDAALVVHDERLPGGVVAIGSFVRLCERDQGREELFQLVCPGDAEIASGRLSVIAPLGAAIVGRHSGQVVRSRCNGREAWWCVEEIVCPACRPATSCVKQRFHLGVGVHGPRRDVSTLSDAKAEFRVGPDDCIAREVSDLAGRAARRRPPVRTR